MKSLISSLAKGSVLLSTLCATGLMVQAPQVASAAYEPGSLVAYWPLEEGSGSTSADLSGNGNDVAVKSTGTTWQPAGGQFGGALEFDGSTGHGTFNGSAALSSLGATGTISFWVYPHNLGRRNQFFEGPGNANFECQFRTNSGGQFYGSPDPLRNDYAIEAGGSAGLVNSWICLQYTWDFSAGEMHIYKNGVEVSYLAGFDSNIASWSSAVDMTSGVCYVGRDPGDASRYFDGLMDDFALYDAVLTGTDLDDIRNNGASTVTTNQVIHYSFDETSGSTAADSSGNGINLTLPESGPDLVSGEMAPVADSAGSLNFASPGAPAVISDSASLDWDKSEGTILMWYRPETTSTRQAVIHGLNSLGSKTFEVQVSGSSGSLQYRPFLSLQPSTNSYYPLTALSTQAGMGNENTWHHIAWSWDMSRTAGTASQPNRIRGFHNGAYTDCYVGTSGTNPDANWNTAPVTDNWILGYYNNDARDLTGNLAEIAIFNVGLSDEDVDYIYEYGVNAFLTAPNLTGIDLADASTTDNCNPTSYTNSLEIDVTTLGVTGTAGYVLVSEDNFATSTSLAYASTVQYNLQGNAEGDRDLWVRMGDSFGNASGDTVMGSIIYDESAPTGSAVTGPSGAAMDVAGVVDVAFTAPTDPGAQPSGVTGVRLYYRKDAGSWTAYDAGTIFSSSPIAFDTNTTGGSGSYEVYCAGVDCAGNEESKAQAAEQTFTVSANVGDWKTLD